MDVGGAEGERVREDVVDDIHYRKFGRRLFAAYFFLERDHDIVLDYFLVIFGNRLTVYRKALVEVGLGGEIRLYFFFQVIFQKGDGPEVSGVLHGHGELALRLLPEDYQPLLAGDLFGNEFHGRLVDMPVVQIGKWKAERT